ncbi:cytochrome c oxidase cbb3-type subunit 4 [Altererythrobacter atlanticus]|uniref:Cbb3-type cytochrome oxidase component FixQ n=1 Tax=Croceibacterium atlanticum TaxID=1267766 RepID=A0A0F7KX58_9SPHN|nr:cbb3-type cytochrome c oxidase subunit 3 [Croceibacterium atlanticum]AKH43786.1 Cbb3-type cytochrome oxidase component FixQ [Croceibacterium atlanticum]MBB5733765.1 cytochrome c oxidase cbb3-type subunit 4 [Croceibacterium atlanticum]
MINDHSTYETLRHLADSYGLMIMVIAFLALSLWPFRPGARKHHQDAANVIFKDDNDGE